MLFGSFSSKHFSAASTLANRALASPGKPATCRDGHAGVVPRQSHFQFWAVVNAAAELVDLGRESRVRGPYRSYLSSSSSLLTPSIGRSRRLPTKHVLPKSA